MRFTNMEFKPPPDTLVHDSLELLMKTPALTRWTGSLR
jgi:hypothetical protein